MAFIRESLEDRSRARAGGVDHSVREFKSEIIRDIISRFGRPALGFLDHADVVYAVKHNVEHEVFMLEFTNIYQDGLVRIRLQNGSEPD